MKKLNKHVKGIVISLISISTFAFFMSFNAYASEEHSQEPIWDPNKVVLESHKLAPDVYAFYQQDANNLTKKGVPLATSGGFIVGDNGVMLIETMINKRLFNQAISMIKAVTDKPIIYAVNTSYHGDHSYGNYLLSSDVKIIQHVNAKKYIHENFQKDIEFMLQNFGKGRNIEDTTPREGDILISENGEQTIDLGNIQVLIKDFGFAQTGGDLFIWLADQKVMWTGNAIISAAPSLPWLLDGHLEETLSTLKKVYSFLPADAAVVPGHGATTDPNAIKWNIDYLQEISDGVKKAIAEGKTLEETKTALPMKKYDVYALYNWLHFSLNIPAAYKDLSTKK